MSDGFIFWRFTKDAWRWQLYLVPAIILWPMHGEDANERFWFLLCFGVGRRK